MPLVRHKLSRLQLGPLSWRVRAREWAWAESCLPTPSMKFHAVPPCACALWQTPPPLFGRCTYVYGCVPCLTASGGVRPCCTFWHCIALQSPPMERSDRRHGVLARWAPGPTSGMPVMEIGVQTSPQALQTSTLAVPEWRTDLMGILWMRNCLRASAQNVRVEEMHYLF